jgi:general secretion pathway protein C
VPAFERLLTGEQRLATARAAVEVVLVLLLATQAARLVWTVVAPAPPPPPVAGAAQADLAILAQFNPFLGLDTPAGGRASGDGLRLYGIRADGAGRGSAIIGSSDGRQASYLVGETIAPGVTLQAVEENHVVLSRGGTPSKLAFPDPAQ